ncbi:hypothetical protein PENPOL_c002G00579 [Penicillium polonicum]|uniref:Uncharacterized protein n=1 Tax=Penicillium polonicum TaxID=60169 RepID=A0A1V6NY55_PENPO|nr:hypothetical protein PENPOL_c002G00579 [Penicillium polonicum]
MSSWVIWHFPDICVPGKRSVGGGGAGSGSSRLWIGGGRAQEAPRCNAFSNSWTFSS